MNLSASLVRQFTDIKALTPEIVAAFICWKWLSVCGTVLSVMDATVDRGTLSPAAVRM